MLLLDQDRARGDRLLIARGLAALDRAETLAPTRGPYGLQATIAACLARAATPEATDWVRIAALYVALAQRAPSPVAEFNRVVALGMAFGPAAGWPATAPSGSCSRHGRPRAPTGGSEPTQETASATARPAWRPENRQPPRKVPSSER